MDVMTENKVLPKLRFGEFKDDWNTLTLEKLSIINMGQSPESKSYNQLGEGMLLVQGNADIKNRLTNPRQWTSEPTKKCQIGDLILTVRAPVGAIAKSVHNACIGRGVCSISNNSKSDIEYLYQTLVNYEKKWIRLEQGSTFTAVSGKDIRGIKLNIPSLPEQKKIALFLSAVDGRLQQLTKKKELLEEYKKGVMQKIFSQELRFKDDNGNNYPYWEEKKLGDLCDITTGKSNREDSGIDGKYTFFDRSEDIRKSSIYLFDAEAVIVAGEGSSFPPKYFRGKFDLHQRTYAIMGFENLFGRYLFYYLHQYKNYFVRYAVGSTVKSLRLPIFKKMNIYLPSFEEQKKIANFLSSLDSKIELVSTQIENTKSFKKGLLQQMFV